MNKEELKLRDNTKYIPLWVRMLKKNPRRIIRHFIHFKNENGLHVELDRCVQQGYLDCEEAGMIRLLLINGE